ncbi:MAG: hypothetical protein M0002_11435 [Rhodospirillales bacterium]|nr:hypothetical protein [Rhodospirillales bacterium]
MKDTVLVFTRVPRLGTVKHRLAAGSGAQAALRFHRATLCCLLRRLLSDRRFATVLCVTPNRTRLVLPGALGRRLVIRPQGPGDLGARMARAFRAFPRPAAQHSSAATFRPSAHRTCAPPSPPSAAETRHSAPPRTAATGSSP